MTNLLSRLALVTAALASSAADAAHNVCVAKATGVPSRQGPPQWLDWAGTDHLVDGNLDDPRWLGATGHSFTLGAARAPLQSRMLWTQIGATRYLMMSFIVDLEGLSGAGAATPRDLFLGFRRPAPFTHGTPNTDDDEYGYVFQFHLTGGASSALVAPRHCASYNACAETPGPGQDFWRVFVDRDAPGACTMGSSTVVGPSFLPLTGAGFDGAPISWMTHPAASVSEDAVRYWKLDATATGPLQNRWAVQLRVKLAATDNEPLESGLPPSAAFWYQGAAQVAPTGDYAALGWWPRELTQPLCVKQSTPNMLVHPQLGDATSCAGSSAPCAVANYSALTLYSGARPATCDKGLSIDTSSIGAIVANGATNFSTVWPNHNFVGNATNTVIAQVTNTGSADVTAPLLARFRLAEWGSAPWISTTDHGVWKDMRGAESGVCAAGSPPSCTSSTVSAFADADRDGRADSRTPIKFAWTIGNDATLGASEFCKFGLTPPAVGGTPGACVACSCGAPGSQCESSSDTGTRANVGMATPCVSSRIQHQCMFVELSAPNGGVDFVQQSSWNNMSFAQMSTVSREALIDARQLPTKKGQKEQDIYVFAMPRNMPGKIPTQDGGDFVRERALVRAETIAAPYLADLSRKPQVSSDDAARLEGIAAPLAARLAIRGAVSHARENDKKYRERVQRVAQALQIMAPADAQRVVGMLTLVLGELPASELNQAMVSAIGPAEAADIVPTLELYPFYLPFAEGGAYMPMTAFSVFLGHDGAMSGIDWRLDGAEQVGQNLFHLRIPIGTARKIQIRAQAIEPSEQGLGPAQPRWPCSTGGCASCGGGASRNCGLLSLVGNGLPLALAGVFVRRRRKSPAP